MKISRHLLIEYSDESKYFLSFLHMLFLTILFVFIDYAYYHYYRYYKRKVAPKVDVRIVIAATISVISVLQVCTVNIFMYLSKIMAT